MRLIYFKGATAYEFQLGKFWAKWCFIKAIPLWEKLTIGWSE